MDRSYLEETGQPRLALTQSHQTRKTGLASDEPKPHIDIELRRYARAYLPTNRNKVRIERLELCFNTFSHIPIG